MAYRPDSERIEKENGRHEDCHRNRSSKLLHKTGNDETREVITVSSGVGANPPKRVYYGRTVETKLTPQEGGDSQTRLAVSRKI